MAAQTDEAVTVPSGNSSGASSPPSTSAATSSSAWSRFALLGSDFADVFVFRSVANTAQLVALFNRHALNAALINPALVPSTFPLLAAATKTAAAQRTPSAGRPALSPPHQLLFNMAPSTHVQTAIARFVPDVRQTDVMLVTINVQDTAAVLGRVQGVRAGVGEGVGGGAGGGLDGVLRELCDVELVKKVYKVTEAELVLGGGDAYEALQQAVTCRIAIK